MIEKPIPGGSVVMNTETPESIDYLRSIGVATSEEDRQLITIKN